MVCIPLPIIFPMEPPGKNIWFSRIRLTKKIKVLEHWNYLRHSTTGISENAHKKYEKF